MVVWFIALISRSQHTDLWSRRLFAVDLPWVNGECFMLNIKAFLINRWNKIGFGHQVCDMSEEKFWVLVTFQAVYVQLSLPSAGVISMAGSLISPEVSLESSALRTSHRAEMKAWCHMGIPIPWHRQVSEMDFQGSWAERRWVAGNNMFTLHFYLFVSLHFLHLSDHLLSASAASHPQQLQKKGYL